MCGYCIKMDEQEGLLNRDMRVPIKSILLPCMKQSHQVLVVSVEF